MDLLVLGPNNLDERLVMVWDSGTIDLAKTILEERVHEGDTPAAKAAWRLILKLAATEEWAEDFACSRWPENAERAFDIFAQAQAPLPSAQLLQKAINAFIHVGPARRSELGGFFALSHAMDGRKIAIAHSELEKLARPTSQLKDRRGEFKIPSATGPLSVQIITLDTVAAYEVFEQARGGNESWSAFTSSLDFLRHPDPDSLASALQSVAARSFQLAQGFAAELPWPVGSLIDEADGPDQLNAIAAEVKAGERGTLRDWQAAERRWRHQGVVLEDFEYARSGKRFGSDIARVGLPLARISSISQASEMLDVFKRMTKLSGEIPNHNIRNQVLETAGLALFGLEPDSIREPLLAEHALAAMAVRRVINLDLLEQIEATVLEDPNVLRGLSEVANRCGLYVTSDLSPSRFIRCFNENKLNRGLLHVITTVLFGRKVSRPFLQALRTLSPEGFTPEETDTLNVKASVATLRFAMGITATLPEDMDIIIRHATPWLFEQVQELLTSDEVALSERISVCVCLIQTLRSAADTRERLVYDPLRRALDARRSNIHDRHIWCDTLRLSYDSHDCLSPPQRAAA
jgi:hypothetical protein